MKPYKTVAGFASAEFIERKSRFIGYIMPVTTTDEAEEFIEKIRKQHRDATHNVYAYVLREGQLARYSDNGEPQGTAGIPVLDVIQKSGLVDVCVVATRYFGGILLGGGGLVRAYSHTASIAIGAGTVQAVAPYTRLQILCDYGLYGKLTYCFPQFGVITEASEFTDVIELTLVLLGTQVDAFCKEVTEITNGQAVITVFEADVMMAV